MAVDLTSFEGLAKRVHGALKNIVPDYDKYPFIGSHPINDDKRIGEEFSDTIQLTMPAGFTNSAGGLATMEQVASGSTARATAKGWDLILREKIALDILHAAAKQGEQAFVKTFAYQLMLMKQATFHRLELNAYNGGKALAIAATGAGGIVHTGGQTTATIVVNPGSWVPAAFMGSQPFVDFYDNNAGTFTKLNTNALVQVTSVTYTNNATISMTLSGNATDLAAIDTSQGTRPVEVWFRNTRTNSALIEARGLLGVSALAAGETYLGIGVNESPVFWSGSQFDANGAITLAKIEAAVMQMANKGAHGKFIVSLSLPAYKDISSEVRSAGGSTSSNVRTDANHSKQVMGSKVYEIITAAGPAEIHACRFHPLGKAVIYVDDSEHISRVGSAEASKDLPGVEGPAWERLENETGVQIVSFSHSLVWVSKPANVGEIFGITFS